MAKIPFDIKYRPQIESGEYKVETRSGLPARIVCWDRKTKDMEILALVYDEHIEEDNEDIAEVALNGKMFPRGKNHDYDLFIVTPEEEMTEWERFISTCLQKHGLLDCDAADRIAKKSATELLFLAREQFIKDGYVIEKKIFHDAVKRVDPGIMKEVSKNVDMQIALRTEYEKGRADVLKDLPRWKKCQLDDSIACVYNCAKKEDSLLYYNGHTLRLIDLEKLPGFKEDEK